jgi:predicted DsbA family dithiol-disulfide isomerase
VSVEPRSFILVSEERSGRVFTDYHLMHRRAAAAQAEDAPHFDLPPAGTAYPRSSLPALEAAAWARRTDPGRAPAFDLGLFEAFFGRTLDISHPGVLGAIAKSAGLDGAELQRVLGERRFRPHVEAEHLEAVRQGLHAIPAVVLPGSTPLVGAVPYPELRRAAEAALHAARAARVRPA